MRCSWTFSTQKSKQRTSNRASSEARIVFWMFSISYCRVRKRGTLLGCKLPTLPSVATSDMSLLLSLATNTRATSRSFLPHSSVFVARNIQAAAISCKNRVVKTWVRTWQRKLDLFRIILNRIPHVKPMVPSGSGRHCR